MPDIFKLYPVGASVEDYDEAIIYFSEFGTDDTDLEDVWKPVLRIGDRVQWKRSRPMRHRFIDFDAEDGYLVEPLSGTYWIDEGKILTGVVGGFVNPRDPMNILDDLHFFPWDLVREGDILVQIDPNPGEPEILPPTTMTAFSKYFGEAKDEEDFWDAAQDMVDSQAYRHGGSGHNQRSMMDLAEAGWVRAHYNQTSGKFVWPPGPTGPAPTYKKGTLPKVPPDLPLPGPKSTISIIEPTKISVYVPPEPTIIKPPKVKIIRPPEPEIYRPSPPEPAPPEPLPPEELPERERKLIKKKKKIEVAV